MSGSFLHITATSRHRSSKPSPARCMASRRVDGVYFSIFFYFFSSSIFLPVMVSSHSFSPDQADTAHNNQVATSHETERALNGHEKPLSHAQIKRATRARLFWAIVSSFFLLIALVFLILVEVGNTSIGSVVNKIYFININLSQIVPQSVPNAVLINNDARELGLHDFYTVGLWGWCEGYFGQGVTSCSKPKALYWFDPVGILDSQLLRGASSMSGLLLTVTKDRANPPPVTIPSQVTTYLHILRIASQCMFGLFLTGTCLTFVLIFLSLLNVYSHWVAFVIGIFSLLNAIIVTVATVLGTAIFVILQVAFTSVDELNIKANIGRETFAFMWIAALSTVITWIIHTSMCCCCTSRRGLKTGRKQAS